MDILENYMSNYVEDIERSIWARIFFLSTMLHLDLHSPPVILAQQGRRKK